MHLRNPPKAPPERTGPFSFCEKGAKEMLPEAIAEHLKALETRLEQILASPVIRLGTDCRKKLPELPGVYRFLAPAQPIATVRAGRGDITLLQRIYTNHIMGDQSGTLRWQL